MKTSYSRVVVVTGGSKGIGRAVAHKFAGEKARLILVHFDADDSASQETLKQLSEKGVEAVSYRVDVSSFKAVEELFSEIYAKFEKIDVLVNNAGITKDALFMRMTEEVWDAVLNVNLKSVFNCTQSVIRAMVKQRQGRIVNVSSVVGQIGNPGQANYSASKAGVMAFTKTIAKEVASRGITVNAVAPGFILTEMTEVLPDKIKNHFMQQIPFGRMGSPEEVADAIYWLCSEQSTYITGQIIHVNGGMYM